MPRLFVAALLPEEMRPALRAASGRLREAVSRADMVDPDLFHLTLRFIGQVDDNKARQLREWFLTLTAPCEAHCGVALGRYGGFPARDGQILWAGLDCGPGIEAFRQRVNEGLASFGCLPDERAFVPHVTLARRARLNTPLAALAPLPLDGAGVPCAGLCAVQQPSRPGGPSLSRACGAWNKRLSLY
ncbi:MAG: RNA 2',3'-cyclic phosphodiesterase [Christensenellales bacterium]